VPAVDEQLAQISQELSAIAERLADLALDRLHRALDADEPEAVQAQADERRITRARRAVEKAAIQLQGDFGESGTP